MEGVNLGYAGGAGGQSYVNGDEGTHDGGPTAKLSSRDIIFPPRARMPGTAGWTLFSLHADQGATIRTENGRSRVASHRYPRAVETKPRSEPNLDDTREPIAE